jgi:hypothetical protein
MPARQAPPWFCDQPHAGGRACTSADDGKSTEQHNADLLAETSGGGIPDPTGLLQGVLDSGFDRHAVIQEGDQGNLGAMALRRG